MLELPDHVDATRVLLIGFAVAVTAAGLRLLITGRLGMPRRLYVYHVVSGAFIGLAAAGVVALDVGGSFDLAFAALFGLVAIATRVLLSRRGFFR